MFELNLPDAGGNANTEPSPAPDTPPESAIVSGDSGEDTPPVAADTSTDGDDSPADLSVKTPEEEDDDETPDLSDDPAAPAWYRNRIKQASEYTAKLKEARQAAETRAQELAAQYEGKEIADPAEIERMRGAEERLLSLQSPVTTPEDIDKAIRELNPRVYQDYQNSLVIKALEKPDGTPDIENLQFLVDRVAGEEGAVKAEHVLMAIEALKNGTVDPVELYDGRTQAEVEAYRKQLEATKELEARHSKLTETEKYQETQVRQGELQKAIGAMQQEVDSRISPLIDKFKLSPLPNEPQVISDFKADMIGQIQKLVVNSATEIKELAEIKKAFDLIGTPGKKPVDAKTAAEDVRSFLESPYYKQHVAKGMSQLATKVEKLISRAAYQHKLLALGLEVENSKGQKARPVIGQPNQSANLPKLTAEDLAKMSQAERAEHSAAQLSESIRSMRYGEASRVG